MKAPQNPRAKPARKKTKGHSRKEPVDELAITRGQNAEKGNTLKRDQIRDEGLVSH